VGTGATLFLVHDQVTFLPYAPFRGIRHLKIGSETLDIRKGADRFSPLVECLGFHLYRLAGSTAPWYGAIRGLYIVCGKY
jgi:hypothetical protein